MWIKVFVSDVCMYIKTYYLMREIIGLFFFHVYTTKYDICTCVACPMRLYTGLFLG